LAQAVEGAKPEREYRILHERKKLVEQAEELRELFYKIDLDTWPTWPTWQSGYPLGRLVGCPACGEGLYPMVWIRLTILHCLGGEKAKGLLLRIKTIQDRFFIDVKASIRESATMILTMQAI